MLVVGVLVVGTADRTDTQRAHAAIRRGDRGEADSEWRCGLWVFLSLCEALRLPTQLDGARPSLRATALWGRDDLLSRAMSCGNARVTQ